MREKHYFRTILFLLIFILASLSFAQIDSNSEKVEALFAQWDKKDSPGCALVVIRDGKILYKRGYGMANLELEVPITPQSVFYIGSVSKQFVSACIGLLAIQGKLTLDDDIRKYVPEMPEYQAPVTIRHLIHHTSGLRDYLTLLGIAGIDFGTYHEQDVLDLITRQKELNFNPGDEYLYSNSGYFMLSVIVHRASGKSLKEFAEEHIFKPLGMNNSRFHDDYTQLIKNRATGYFSAGKGEYRNFISTFDNVGSGGLFTSVEDLFLWDQNFYHHKVGGRELYDLMHTKGKLNSGDELDYAFAIDIGSYKGLKTVEHGGALGGYRSALTRFPDFNFSVVILSNLSTFNPTDLAYKVADVFLADFFSEAERGVKTDEKKTVQIPEEQLRDKAGSYISLTTGNNYRIRLTEGALEFSGMGQKFTLGAVNEHEFIILDIPISIKMTFGKPGEDQPMRLFIDQPGRPTQTYHKYERSSLTLEELEEYIGDYDSEELGTTFQISLQKERLRFTHRNAPSGYLVHLYKDIFSAGSQRILFSRKEDGQISSFIVNAGRVTHLLFVKK